MTLTLEVAAATRSWPCRLMHHSGCRTAYRSSRAVVYLTEAGTLPAVGWLRCPCRCHGALLAPADVSEGSVTEAKIQRVMAVIGRCHTARARAAATGNSAEAMAYDDAAEWLRRALEER